jgi:uncharacterized lipoprotein YddW (UPF0748 family)
MRFPFKLLFLVVCVVAISALANSASEFRGLYVDAFHPGFKSHEEVTQMVNAAKEGNFNALIVQVRKRADAYYNSHVEPKALDIAADYDPLADIVAQAHAAGIQVHAWVSVFEVALDSYPPEKRQICLAHPDWLTAKKDGATSLGKGKIFLDPGVPAVREHILSLVCEIAKNYAVDGIHLEGARYLGRDSGYNPISLALFKAETGTSEVPAFDDPNWCEWRRSQLTGLVRTMKARLAEVRPGCLLSASVMTPTPALASMVCLQDWDGWMREGIVDYVVPMLYLTSDSMLEKAIPLLQSRYSRHMYIGVGTYQLPKETAEQQIADVGTAGADGVVLFSYHYLVAATENPDPIRPADLAASVFAQPEGGSH